MQSPYCVLVCLCVCECASTALTALLFQHSQMEPRDSYNVIEEFIAIFVLLLKPFSAFCAHPSCANSLRIADYFAPIFKHSTPLPYSSLAHYILAVTRT
jgi:hypothetical protein